MTARRPLTDFERRLLAELKEIVGERASVPGGTAPRSSRRRGRALGVAAAGVTLALGLPLLHDGTVPSAYAVQPAVDGSVTVTINRIDDAAGLEGQLRAHDVPAVVVYTPDGKTCREPWLKTTSAPPRLRVDVTGSAASFRVRPSDLETGQTLVVRNMTVGGPDPATAAGMIAIAVTEGAAPPCVLVDAPALREMTPTPDPRLKVSPTN
ncbi:hypothetical protein SAMN05421504_1011212 [Amycolatopsis xylanica]|uniref:Uncharacterized protein n=1 Tax=Amycolatopsis xylanica TaxID=589385 RepID=A0A1H2VFS7_9PSEU|nr:hypothetical protein [Amycolatopsis xylanica]SDW67177.1 hypothetical protein SAMN05421504_1011212 [Amycolatopsis xylanica]